MALVRTSQPAPGTRRRLLIMAYAFSPVLGSEYRQAWELVGHFARTNDVTVIFGDSDGIMSGFDHFDAYARRETPTFTAVKVAASPRAQQLARLMLRMPWALLFPALLRAWHQRAFRTAQQLHAEAPFDVVHQLGPIGFRNPGYAWKLGCHSYWGPIGGAQFIDTRMVSRKWSSYFLEVLVRNLSVRVQAQSRYIADAARNFDRLSFATVENADYFRRHFNRSGPVISDQGLYISDSHTALPKAVTGPLRVAWAGSLTPRKNVAALLDIIRAAPAGIEFEVIGDGPLAPAVAAQAAAHPNLRFHGRVPRPEVMQLLGQSDVILLTSLSEANTAILFEGLEHGCIPVAPKINGFVSTLNDSFAILVAQGDPGRAVADSVAALVALADPVTRQRYRKALADALPALTWEHLAAAHEAQYG